MKIDAGKRKRKLVNKKQRNKRKIKKIIKKGRTWNESTGRK